MVESAKTMFFLSLGLLFVGVGSLDAAEEASKKATNPTEEKIVANDDKEGALVSAEDNKVEVELAKEQEANGSETFESDDADAEKKANEPGYSRSCWNSISGKASDMGTYAWTNPCKSIVMICGVIGIFRFARGLFAEEESRTVRRRPRYNRPTITE